MVFKEPQTRAEAVSIGQRRDALVKAAEALEYCKIEPDTVGKLRRIAAQMNNAIQRASLTSDRPHSCNTPYGPACWCEQPDA